MKTMTRHEKINAINELSRQIGEMHDGTRAFDAAKKEHAEAELARLWQQPTSD